MQQFFKQLSKQCFTGSQEIKQFNKSIAKTGSVREQGINVDTWIWISNWRHLQNTSPHWLYKQARFVSKEYMLTHGYGLVTGNVTLTLV